MSRLTRRGSLNELRQACDALNAAEDTDTLASVLSKCLIEALGFERVLFLIPQTSSKILCLTATHYAEEGVSSPCCFHAEHYVLMPDDRAWLECLSAIASPEVDERIHRHSSLYQFCLQQMSTRGLLCFPLRRGQQLWAALMLPELSGHRNWREHILPTLTVLTSHVELCLKHIQSSEQASIKISLKEYDGNEMIGALAHELRNPLNSIKASAQFLRAKYSDHASIYKFLTIIIDEVDHLSSMTKTLLEFARPLKLELARHDVNALMRHVLHFMGHVFSEHHIEVATTLLPDLPYVLLDVKLTEQALRNAMLNAVEAMPHGGRLQVVTCVEGRHVQIHISDSGVGIQGDEADKVFTSFYTTKPNGTGLGLPILHRIVKSHGGAVALESEAGVGTSLILSLPVAEEGEPPEGNGAMTGAEAPRSVEVSQPWCKTKTLC
jgi:signal transduction histidine kinase